MTKRLKVKYIDGYYTTLPASGAVFRECFKSSRVIEIADADTGEVFLTHRPNNSPIVGDRAIDIYFAAN